MLAFAVICLLPLLDAAAVATVDQSSDHSPKGWTDEYIDLILTFVQAVIKDQGLDPADLPELKVSFSDTVLGITWHGSAKVYNGRFSGLSTIHRAGNTDFTLDGTTLNLIANLGLNDCSAHYEAQAEFMGITVGASATVKISSVDVFFDAEMIIAPGSSLQIARFEITNIGHIDINVSGLGPLDWILELLVEGIGNSIRGWLADIIEGPLRDILQDILDQYVPEIPSKLF
ncbi:uncharacterized protein LOC111718083 [Eurytemora carolleeae]|uniref:uncharacterized protein LOC111718083 n=1 Tax=Eurytemora carolleeae TaxID=1294199 RepID=UPI000C76D2A0|nr:uncharacterized protein LOC111718083 [Eurytemora carolleeae]|eukprot:XP_023349348.1 uncharacterized protein LOC111718083 [Eurytemora affinis]